MVVRVPSISLVAMKIRISMLVKLRPSIMLKGTMASKAMINRGKKA